MTEWEKKRAALQGDPARKREMDDFWDVEKLLPDRPARPVPPPRREAPTAVEVELTANSRPPRENTAAVPSSPVGSVPLTVTAVPLTDGAPSAEETAGDGTETSRYVPPHKRETGSNRPVADYRPDGVLLHRVRVYGWQTGYHYFDSFVEDAQRYDAMCPPKTAEKTGFFS